jgi:hypothetical protein
MDNFKKITVRRLTGVGRDEKGRAIVPRSHLDQALMDDTDLSIVGHHAAVFTLLVRGYSALDDL